MATGDIVFLNLEGGQRAIECLSYIIAHATDNSCGDPDCCGIPYYNDDTAAEYEAELAALGIQIIE